MKYYTYDYINSKRYLDCLKEYEPILDKYNSSKELISSLYQKKLEERLLQAEKDFNTPLKMKETREEAISTYYDKKYPKYDLYSKRIIGYLSLEEVLYSYDAKVKKYQEMFLKRGSFDRQRQIDLFASLIKEKISSNFEDIPFSLSKQVDPLLLALGYIPETLYKEYSLHFEKEKERLCQIEEKEKKDYDLIKDSLPLKVRQIKEKRYDPLVSIEKKEADILFHFHFEGIKKKESSGFSSLLFKNVKEHREDVPFSIFERKREYDIRYEILYTEIEKKEEDILFSFLLEKKNSFFSISILCEDVESMEY